MNGVKTDKFVEENLGLVHLCANKFRNRGIEYEELYSTGCIGLIKATTAFDVNRGVKFSTYAVPVILGEIKRLFRDGGAIKVSRSLKELSLRLTKIRDEFQLQNGREPTISELSNLSGVERELIVEAVAVSLPPISLTATSEDDENKQIDIIEQAKDIETADNLALKEAMKTLEPKDQQLIFLRYYKNMTQTQTAAKLEMSQVQVSRREKKLLLKLRAFLDT